MVFNKSKDDEKDKKITKMPKPKLKPKKKK